MRTIAIAVCAALAVGSGAGVARAQDLGNLTFLSIGPSISGGRMGDVAGTDDDPMLYYAGAAGATAQYAAVSAIQARYAQLSGEFQQVRDALAPL